LKYLDILEPGSYKCSTTLLDLAHWNLMCRSLLTQSSTLILGVANKKRLILCVMSSTDPTPNAYAIGDGLGNFYLYNDGTNWQNPLSIAISWAVEENQLSPALTA
jgi:hypothetical protein